MERKGQVIAAVTKPHELREECSVGAKASKIGSQKGNTNAKQAKEPKELKSTNQQRRSGVIGWEFDTSGGKPASRVSSANLHRL